MDHAIGSTPARAGREPSPPRPGWWWTFGSLLLAFLLGTGGLLLVVLPLTPLGVDASLIVSGRWPWASDSPWAFVAAASPALPAAALYALGLRVAVETRSEWKVRLWPVALTFLVVLLLGRDAEPGDGLAFVSFVATLVVARYVAIVPQRPAWRPSRGLVVVAALGALALTAVTVAYRPLHPLHVQLGNEHRFGNHGWGLPDANRRVLEFGVSNESFAAARILTAHADVMGAPVVVQIENAAEVSSPLDWWVPLPAGGVELASDATFVGRVRLAPGTCRDGGAHRTSVTRLTLQVETLGTTRTQRFAPAGQTVLRCPA